MKRVKEVKIQKSIWELQDMSDAKYRAYLKSQSAKYPNHVALFENTPKKGFVMVLYPNVSSLPFDTPSTRTSIHLWGGFLKGGKVKKLTKAYVKRLGAWNARTGR